MTAKRNLNDLLKQMTLEEKIGQLLQLIPDFYSDNTKGEVTGPLNDLGLAEKDVWQTGSVLGAANAQQVIDVQKKYLENNRLGIPLVFMADVIHGYRTIFPIPLALGASWDVDAAEEMANVSAVEAAVAGTHVTFSPMVDLVRDPRWGRVLETTGEDAYLNGLFAKAFVKGYQGDLTGEYDIAACVKHFAGYGAAEAGRDYNTVDMSDRTLREYYLPAYKAALDAGCKMVMTSFNTVHGVPSTGNEYLMKNILRDEWGFDGVVVSDWGAVGELIPHGAAEDGKEAAERSIKATVDLEMMTSHYVNNLVELIQEGAVAESEIDACVLRILQLKEDLGLFDNPYKAASPEKEKELVLCDAHREAARRIARKTMVLLKNEEVLPLQKGQKVALIGPHGDNQEILGAWSWQGRPEEAISLHTALVERIGEGQVTFARGCELEGTVIDEEVVRKAVADADVVILAIGEPMNLSGEAASRSQIKLTGAQEELAAFVKSLGKPVATVLFNGRPLEITNLVQHTDAILEAWYPGSEAGHAVVDVLYGDHNPSARLTMSFPYAVGQIPVYYNCYNTGRPVPEDKTVFGYFSQYKDIPNKPLYPFGYGLSYTSFAYDEMAISQEVITKDETITVSVKVKNTGKVEGIETVQLYIRDMAGSTVRPIKELKAYERVSLQPGEEREVQFSITEEMLKYHTLSGRFEAEKGNFRVMVGPHSEEVMEKGFKLI
ncbi:MAG: glycoside hydrolase family 3 N-terminal domain-containing protein [Cellulosilyticaceae bacterium]